MPTKVKSDPKKMDVLLSSKRRRTLDTHRLLSLIPIHLHHVVADIGCGPGYFTIPLGKYLFDGKVFALDVQQEMLDATRTALDAIHLTNVEVMRSKESKLPLEDDSLDGALVAFVLQEASNARALLKDTLRCLKKTGWLAVLEWNNQDVDGAPPLTQRIEEGKLLRMAEKLGFRTTARHNLSGNQYMIVMKK